MNAELFDELETLRKLSSKNLKSRYRELFGEESASSNPQHLFRRIAWQLQAKVQGDLSEEARQRAQQLAEEASLRLRPPRTVWETPAKPALIQASRDRRLPATGEILKRSYHGKTIVVTVFQDDFEYNGKRYASLSAIAYRATGTRWNGYLFFGLGKQQDHD